MIKNIYYDRLMKSEPMGFIDPLSDLGEFDTVQMKFKKPVRQLVNKYSGQPFNANWQKKIEEMRVLYIQYQESIKAEDEEIPIQKRVRGKESKKHADEIVTTYLKLGFRFREIEKRVSISYKSLHRSWSRSDHVTTQSAEFYRKKDLQDGVLSPSSVLPKSMKIN